MTVISLKLRHTL